MTNFSPKFDSLPSIDHQGYPELCALATTGTLTDEEWNRLKAHIASCSDCHRSMQEYREIARTGMSLLMPERSEGRAKATESWSHEPAKHELFQRIARGEETAGYHRGEISAPESLASRFRSWLLRPRIQPSYAWVAATILIGALMVSSYRLGVRKEFEIADAKVQLSASNQTSLQQELDKLKRERTSLRTSLSTDSAQLLSLQGQLKRLSAETESWKALQTKTSSELQQQALTTAALQSDLNAKVAEHDALTHKLQASEAELQDVQLRYDNLRQQHTAELLRTASIESQLVALSARLKDAEANLKQHEQFLASDRDIRELMGARELYIADVFDVDVNGDKRRPFGRVFYTTGQSLIFYAFDLDQQPRMRNADTFQAWGRHGVGDRNPLNLGIFYVDNKANRRWVLKFDNPDALSQVDAVFVTVEPHRGSQTPSGKQLLFASLRTKPNHP
jgi:dimeric dUTPase (all-alpha-NTP-PPase superfamily)